MLRSSIVGFCIALLCGADVRAQDSTEPPPPKAAPRASIMAEELPRAGAILVFGADRPLGLEIVKALAAANKQVTAAIPLGADAAPLTGLKVATVSVDPLNPDQLKESFREAPLRAVIAIYDVAGDAPTLGLDGSRNIIDVTKALSIPRLLFVSATGAGDSAAALPWYVRMLRGDSIARAGVAEDHLKDSGIDFTILRAGWLVADPPAGKAALQDGAPAFSWITLGDLAQVVAGAIDSKATSGKAVTVFDPERTSLFSVIF